MPLKPFTLDSDVPKGILSTEGSLTPFIVNQRKLWGFKSGRLYSTSRVTKNEYIDLLKKLPRKAEMKHFAVRPLNPVKTESKKDKHRHLCLKWLDKQEKDSAIYISFGSTTSMTDEQITELAFGQERSGQKFIWVLRRADTCNIFTGDEVRMPQLPEGYKEKMKQKGIVVQDGAPYIGGFMSHCGWNSCMESISMGVPMAAWPMHSDQPRNVVLISEVLRMGTQVRDGAHHAELVTSTFIENALRRLMSSEGEKKQIREAELGEPIRASVIKGGTSRLDMDPFFSHVTRE